nr:hypothetical protein [Tanacetum cinerariifolium]
MLRQCPHHGFLELHQIDTFYNGLNEHEQDSLNATAGGNLSRKTLRDVLTIIENKSKVRYSRHKPVAFKVSTTSSGNSSSTNARIDKLTDTISNLVETFNKKMTTPAMMKAVEEACVLRGGAHPYYDCIATNSNISSACATTVDFQAYMKANDAVVRNMQTQMTSLTSSNIELKNMFGQFIKMNTASSSGMGSLPSNTVPIPREDLNAITTRSGVTLSGPSVSPPPPSKEMPKVTKDTVQSSTKNIQTSVAQTQVPINEPVVAPKPKPTIPYPSRVNKQKLLEKDDNLALKFVEFFKNLHFELSFADALLHMPKFALMFKSLLNNKEKLFDLSTTLVNENCSTIILKKLPKKLGDLDKFLIPCDFPEFDECLALANLAGIAEEVFVKVGKFHLPTDFVVGYYIVDPRVPLILGRPFLRIERALIDVYGEELTLRVDDEAITFKVGQTLKYSHNDAESINQIDVIDVACEEYVQNVLGFSDNLKSGNPTPTSDFIISSYSPSFTPFKGSDFILEEIKTFLRTPDKLSNLDDDYYDTEGDILYLEKFLNEDPSPNLPPVKTEDLKQVDASMTKPWIEEPPELELKELPSHLEYAFLEETDKLPIIISKELKDEEKSALLKVSPVHCVPKKGGITVVENEDNELIPTRCMMAIFHDMIEKTMEVFMDDFSVFEGIVLGHKISKSGIEVDRAKVDVIAKLPHPTSVKENLAADHLYRLENPHQDELEKKEITETFPLETLGMITLRGDSSTSWIIPDLEASRARDFVHRLLELQSLAYGNLIS